MPEVSKPAAIEAASVPPSRATRGYPKPFAARAAGRERRALGDVFGLTNFGVNLTRLPPGGVSALRHTHMREDEFIYIIEGEPVLATNAGDTPLHPGMCAGFKAGSGDAHHLLNRTGRDVVYLEVGVASQDGASRGLSRVPSGGRFGQRHAEMTGWLARLELRRRG